jgi:hypothetical protein
MNERIRIDRNADVAHLAPADGEEEQVASPDVPSVNWRARAPLLANAARQRHPRPGEDVLDEPAAVEAFGPGTAAAVRRPEESLCRFGGGIGREQRGGWHATRIS